MHIFLTLKKAKTVSTFYFPLSYTLLTFDISHHPSAQIAVSASPQYALNYRS